MNLIYKICIPALGLFFCCTLSVGEAAADNPVDREGKVAQTRSRSASADLLYGRPLPISNWRATLRGDGESAISKRSVPLAFGLSAVIPGLGQAYNRDWIAAAIFVAAEAALLVAHFSYKSSGNEGVDVYEDYANLNWSPIQYAEWLNSYSGYNGPEVGLPSLSEDDFKYPENWTSAQQAEVDLFFEDIRAAERSSNYLTTGASFSHVLPDFGDQQYYELIGKYFQYAPAWNDYEGDPDDNPVDVMPSDAQFYYYSDIHASANDDLRKASVAGSLLILNHFAAAVQSAVMARIHNKKIQPSVAVTQGPRGQLLTTARLAVTF